MDLVARFDEIGLKAIAGMLAESRAKFQANVISLDELKAFLSLLESNNNSEEVSQEMVCVTARIRELEADVVTMKEMEHKSAEYTQQLLEEDARDQHWNECSEAEEEEEEL